MREGREDGRGEEWRGVERRGVERKSAGEDRACEITLNIHF